MYAKAVPDRKTNGVLLFEIMVASREGLLSHGASVGGQPAMLFQKEACSPPPPPSSPVGFELGKM